MALPAWRPTHHRHQIAIRPRAGFHTGFRPTLGLRRRLKRTEHSVSSAIRARSSASEGFEARLGRWHDAIAIGAWSSVRAKTFANEHAAGVVLVAAIPKGFGVLS